METCKTCNSLLEKKSVFLGGGWDHKFFTFRQAARWCDDPEPKEKVEEL